MVPNERSHGVTGLYGDLRRHNPRLSNLSPYTSSSAVIKKLLTLHSPADFLNICVKIN